VRLYKSPEEIQIMHNASTASHKAFNAVVPHLTQLKTEAELAALLNFRMVQGGGDRWAYEPVVAAEGRGTIVHYTQNDMLLGGSVVIDAGCVGIHLIISNASLTFVRNTIIMLVILQGLIRLMISTTGNGKSITSFYIPTILV